MTAPVTYYEARPRQRGWAGVDAFVVLCVPCRPKIGDRMEIQAVRGTPPKPCTLCKELPR